jgi:soluble cytochrome b562
LNNYYTGRNMRNRFAITALCLALGPLAMYGQALAHGTEEHGKMTMDAQMKKLHAMMPMFSTASAQLEAALDKGDTPAAGSEAGKILASIPDLKKSKPHKNIKQHKKFVELATSLDKSVAATNALAQKGDFAGAMAAFKKVEEVCAACHAKFR